MKPAALLALTFASAAALAGPTNPFTETFDNGANNWLGGDFLPPAEHANGGVGDTGYISSQTGFEFNDPGSFNTVFRGNKGLLPGTDASGGAFVGDWIAAGVTNLSFSLRHDIPEPVTVFVRIAADTFGAPFPGAVGIFFVPVFAGEWTDLSIDINPANPQFVTYEDSSFETVFSNVGFIQIGIASPDGLLGDPTLYTVDLDNVAIVPAPAGLLAFAPVLAAATRRRR
ncbi:MAG: hypothetical protein H6810_01735 [Phycisphaeraceae bacterium]|nr:MAG: hypothetical protein H6810_01735 [Phycisphaeraceae bacterium]